MTTLNIPLIRPFRTIVGVIGIKPNKHDGQGAWAKDSSTPPWGWPLAIAAALAVIAVCGFIFSHVGTAVGF